MIKSYVKKISSENIYFLPGLLLVICFPFFTFLPSFFLNFHVIFCSFYFLLLIFKKKIPIKEIFLSIEIKIIFFFSLYLIINIIINQTFAYSLSRSLGFFRFLIFIPMVAYFIQFKNFKYFDFFLKVWSIFFLFISFDLLFEFIIGHNIAGYYSEYPGRLAGLMNDELVIGYFYFLFFLIITIYLTKFLSSNVYKILLFLFFILINFLIGERSNFVKSLLCFLIILPIFLKDLFSRKILIVLTVLFLFLSSTLYFSQNFKSRYIDQFLKPLVTNITEFYHNSKHGPHYSTAIKIFNESPVFGEGLKSFRYACSNRRYNDDKFRFNKKRCSTHPHQIHLEILSELGLVGYFFFSFFIFFYLKNQYLNFKKRKDLLQLSTSLPIISYLILPLPTGSFFSSYSASIFWFIFAISLALRNYKTNFFKK
jgi:O-antigen ligase